MPTFTIDPDTGQNYVDGQPVAPNDPRLHQQYGGTFAGQGLSTPQMQVKYGQSLLDQGNGADAAKALPWEYTLDPETGQIRRKTWWELNGETAKFLAQAGATVGGGFYLSGLGGASGAGGGTAGTGGTGADVVGANALPPSGVTSGLPGASTAGGGGVLSTAQKLLGFNKNDPNSYLKLAGAVGDTLGAAGQGAAQGRITQTELNQRQDQLALQRYQDQLNAPGKIAGNSVRGDILANAKDFSYGAPTMVGNIPVPTSTGGLRPSIFSDSTRALGARQTAEAATMPGPPSLTPMDEAGAGTSILNTAGAIGSFADLLNPNNYKTKIPYQRPMQGQVA